MFKKNKDFEQELKALDAEQANLTEALSKLHPLDNEYGETVKKISDIANIKKDIINKKQIDPNVIISSVAGLLGILVIVGYEHASVITSKGLSVATKMLGK